MKINAFQIIVLLMLCLTTSCKGVENEKQNKISKQKSTPIEQKSHLVDNEGITVNLFIENSGSMKGYFDGQDFQMEIGSLITTLQQTDIVKDAHFYYINKSIYKGSDKSDVFIKDLVSKSNVGIQASTEIGELIEKVADTTYVNKNSVSILVSDFIISPGAKNAANVSASEINKITDVCGKLAVKKYAIAFYRLMVADFNGKYYDCANKPKTLKNAKRPYYIMVVGNKGFIGKFQNMVAPKITNLSGGKAITNHQCYYGLDTINAKFSFPKDVNFRICNPPLLCISKAQYLIEKNNDGDVTKYFTFNIEADSKYLPMLLGVSYLKDKNNYIISDKNAVIDRIVLQKNGKFNFKIRLNSNSKSNTIKPHTLSLKLIIQNPQWISNYNISDCSEIFSEGNEEKTYGLEYVTRGMFSSFYKKTEFTIAEVKFN